MRRVERCFIGLCLASACALASPAAAQPCATHSGPNPRVDVQVNVSLSESYGIWRRHPDNCQAYYAEYTYVAGGVQRRHYVIRYKQDPNHCYCFNPDTRVYWGRWNYGVDITFSKVPENDRVAGRRPHELRFQGEDPTPSAPGTNIPMTPPAPTDLPPV